MKFQPKLLILATCAALASQGCQSTMQVSVQRVEPAGTYEKTMKVHQPSNVPQIHSAVNALLTYESLLTEAKGILGSSTIKEDLGLEGDFDSVTRLVEEGIDLVRSLEQMEERTAEARTTVYVLVVNRFLQPKLAIWSEYQSMVPNATVVEKKAMANLVELKLPQLRGQLVEAKAPEAGFGGFARVGVTRIAPGDANYKAILEGTLQGEPITEVMSTATGDSTLIFVQENPTQLRVYSVDMSAEELVRNAAQISSKAVNAVLKFSNPASAATP